MTATDAVQAIHRKSRWQPSAALRGPVPLNRFFKAVNLRHFAVPGLTTRTVVETLEANCYIANRADLGDLWERDEAVVGFLVVAGDGVAFVDAAHAIGRRRFTAAHELGHVMMHREALGKHLAEHDMEKFDAKLGPLEVEANKFAAELLMPEVVLRARHAAIEADAGRCPRTVLVYQLAGELLVSREAMSYRLKYLEIGDE